MIRYVKMLSSYLLLILAVLGLLIINNYKQQSTHRVTREAKPTVLNFAGFANPITTYNIVSPVDGIVNTILVDYGEQVKKGQVVFILQSTKLETEFRQNVENYIKAKSAVQNSLFKFNGNQELYKLGLISKIAFTDSENEVKTNEIALWDAELLIKKNLLLTGVHYKELEAISLTDLDKVRETLQKAFRGIKITAPNDGILLFSSKTLGSTTGESGGAEGPVKVGVNVKEGAILGVIANMSGLILEITVNETNFKNVHEGQKATVTGPAFGNLTLSGKVIDINHQANSADFNSTPTYTVHVKVPYLTKEQRKIIQVGMSTQVSLTKENPPMIHIPLNALIEHNGNFSVKVLDTITHQINEVPVVTGETDQNSVEILKGLNAGDELVVPN